MHNFDEIPTVHSLDEFWHRKYVEDERTGTLVPAQAGASDQDPGHASGHGSIHLPSPSYWPLVSGLGLPIIGLRRALLLVADRARRARRR